MRSASRSGRRISPRGDSPWGCVNDPAGVLPVAAVLSAPGRDARVAVAVSGDRDDSPDGTLGTRRRGVVGRSAPARSWLAASAGGAAGGGRRTVAVSRPAGDDRHRDTAVHVFRDQVLLPDLLLGEDGLARGGGRLHRVGSPESGDDG